MNTATEVRKDLLKIFGDQVRKHRLSAGLTQEVFAEKCGIYRTYLSRIEGGTANPTLVVLGALADSLRVDLVELLRE